MIVLNNICMYIKSFKLTSDITLIADILVITGTTLINDSLEGILKNAKKNANVMVVGPTASMLPDAFFSRGVSSIGGIIINKPDELLDILTEGGSGYHFFGKSADRVIIDKNH